MNSFRLALLTLLTISACNSPTPEVSKDVVRDQKADGLSDKLCLQLGEVEGCDLCQINSWYGDGECDDFCAERDSDCPIANCTEMDELFSTCVDAGGSDTDCTPPDATADHDLALSCCEAEPLAFCEAVGGTLTPALCSSLKSDYESCLQTDSVSQCLPTPFSDNGEASLACCLGQFDEQLCDDLFLRFDCESVQGDFDSCVFDAMGDAGLTQEEAESACGIELSESGDLCCDEFPESYCQFVEALD